MPKFYVNAGGLKTVIEQETPHKAAVEAFRTLAKNPVDFLCTFTIVSEKGFNKDHDDDWFFSTMDILEQSDQIGYYKHKDSF